MHLRALISPSTVSKERHGGAGPLSLPVQRGLRQETAIPPHSLPPPQGRKEQAGQSRRRLVMNRKDGELLVLGINPAN